jgi:MarR family transcriptional regulator, lower aerobic nicotinate degradation pathway regulator
MTASRTQNLLASPTLDAPIMRQIVGMANVGATNVDTTNDRAMLGAMDEHLLDGQAQPDSPPARLWCLASYLVGQVSGRAHPLIMDALGAGRTKNDYAVLATLAEFGPMSQAMLGGRLAIDRSDVTGVLDKLCAEGLTRRTRDARDHRRNVATITGKGRKRLHRLDTAAAAAQESLLAPLGPAEREQFTEMLRRLVEYHTGWRRPGALEAGG